MTRNRYRPRSGVSDVLDVPRFRKRLLRVIRKKGLSLKGAAVLCRINEPSFHMLLTKTVPGLVTMIRISNGLKVPIDQLVVVRRAGL